jgi:hypothetical protein
MIDEVVKVGGSEVKYLSYVVDRRGGNQAVFTRQNATRFVLVFHNFAFE